jgi:hypothetical protein
MGHGTGFRGPLRYRKAGGQLDECALALVDKLSNVAADDEHTRIFGDAQDCAPAPSIDVGAAETATFSPYALVSGSANAPTIPTTQPDTAGGVLRVQTAGVADNDSALLQFAPGGAGAAGIWTYSTTKRLWFCVRLALQNVANGECTVGLVNKAYNPADLATLPTAGLFFTKAVTATDFTFHARESSTSTTIANVIGSALANDTFVELAFVVEDGVVSVFVNGVKNATGIASSDGNLPLTTDQLKFFLGNATNAAATRYADYDYWVVARER